MEKALLDRRWPWLVAAGAIVLVFLATSLDLRTGNGDPRPVGTAEDIAALRERGDVNLLFILVDTLRADHLSSYGYERDTSPTLDALAGSGVRFARVLSQSSWTKTSMASLWSGLYPSRLGILRYDHVLPEQVTMPAEILREAGFQTAGIFRNGWVAPTFGFEQGFEVYTRPVPGRQEPGVRAKNPTLTEASTDEDGIGSALEFLRINGEDRWFLYLHMMDVHEYVYDEQSALFGGSYRDIYDNAIRRTDDLIGVLMAHLADLGYADETIVAIASDHGEAFRERGYEGHARQVYRESTEVPLLLFLPFRLEPGIVVETRVENVDVWPTLLDLVGLSMPPEVDGRSLVPDMLAAARGEVHRNGDETAVSHLDQTWGKRELPPQDTVAVTEGPLRYVRVKEGRRTRERLFDASKDPAELRDRAEEDPESLARLRSAADAYLEKPPDFGEAPTREIDELELNQLRALGYAIP